MSAPSPAISPDDIHPLVRIAFAETCVGDDAAMNVGRAFHLLYAMRGAMPEEDGLAIIRVNAMLVEQMSRMRGLNVSCAYNERVFQTV